MAPTEPTAECNCDDRSYSDRAYFLKANLVIARLQAEVTRLHKTVRALRAERKKLNQPKEDRQ